MIGYFGVDYGAYTPPETLDYAAMADSGVRLHIVGVTGNPWLVRHIMQAKQAQVPEVALYVIPRRWDWPGDMAMEAAVAQFKLVFPPSGRTGPDAVPDIILDVEADAQDLPQAAPAVNRQWISDARKVAEAHGYSVGKYSNKRMWSLVTGDDPAFDAECAPLPNHDACYDNLPYSGFSGPWGGRATPLINQFAGSVTFCGANTDLNWVEREQRMMTDEQIKEALGNILGTLAAFGKRTDILRDELYKSVSGRADVAKRELEYMAAAGGVTLP